MPITRKQILGYLFTAILGGGLSFGVYLVMITTAKELGVAGNALWYILGSYFILALFGLQVLVSLIASLIYGFKKKWLHLGLLWLITICLGLFLFQGTIRSLNQELVVEKFVPLNSQYQGKYQGKIDPGIYEFESSIGDSQKIYIQKPKDLIKYNPDEDYKNYFRITTQTELTDENNQKLDVGNYLKLAPKFENRFFIEILEGTFIDPTKNMNNQEVEKFNNIYKKIATKLKIKPNDGTSVIAKEDTDRKKEFDENYSKVEINLEDSSIDCQLDNYGEKKELFLYSKKTDSSFRLYIGDNVIKNFKLEDLEAPKNYKIKSIDLYQSNTDSQATRVKKLELVL